ncbi:fimbrillin family protein [Parabacteroides sp. PF5-6]|uniref:fimbrillin family protein n=1 Tax=Parabacteroides sp. PF5-6 TaxID=1742403 RepID=UPI002406F28F|nr:fimbrillin family protein [Parabacteroides sp. PF5-6]MDF9829916.1 hypothetical protein [Parabacteroides sp. PF5-6]
MNKPLVIVSLCLTALLVLFACSADENGGGVGLDGNGRLIRASAQAVSLHSVATKAPYDETTPSEDHPLKARVLASTTSGSYSSWHANGTMTFTGEELTPYDTEDFDGKNYYELTGDHYFCGLYPDTTWSSPTTTASFTFTGKEDVMFAPQVTSDITQAASKPVFQFEHLLTRLNITLVGEDGGIPNAWGEITALALTSVPNTVTVTLGGTDLEKAAPSYTGNATINAHLYSEDDTPVSTETPVTILSLATLDEDETPQPQAYILAAPVTAISGSAAYTLSITTANGSVRTVPLKLEKTEGGAFTGNTRGCSFNIILNFQGDEISVEFANEDNIKLSGWAASLVLQTIMLTWDRTRDAKNMLFALNALNTINANSISHTYSYFGLYGVNDVDHDMEFDVNVLASWLSSFKSGQHVMFDLKKLVRNWGTNPGSLEDDPSDDKPWEVVLKNYDTNWELAPAKQTIKIADYPTVDWTKWAEDTDQEIVDGITAATLPATNGFPKAGGAEGDTVQIQPSPILTDKGTIIIKRK